MKLKPVKSISVIMEKFYTEKPYTSRYKFCLYFSHWIQLHAFATGSENQENMESTNDQLRLLKFEIPNPLGTTILLLPPLY